MRRVDDTLPRSHLPVSIVDIVFMTLFSFVSEFMVTPGGFEPATFALRGRPPKPVSKMGPCLVLPT